MPTDTDASAPKFIVLEKSLIGNRLHEPGEEVTLPPGTLPADNLAATCPAGEALKAEYQASNEARIAKMKREHSESAVGDPLAFSARFAEELARANAEARADITAAVSEGIAKGIAQLIQSGLLTTSGKSRGKSAAATDDLA